MPPSPAVGEKAGAVPAGTVNWRFRLGLAAFVLGLLLPLAALAVPFLGLPPEWAALLTASFLAGAPEVLFLLAVALFGRENFDRLMGVLKGVARRHLAPAPVSRLRYLSGLVLVLASIVPLYLYGYVPGWLPEGWRIPVLAGADLAFLAGLVLMGGEFWGKFRRLFVWEGRA